MNRKFELLAPGGDIDAIKAAIVSGADAVYCGLNKFNARNRAENIDFEDLKGILRLAHKNDCEIFITLNIIIVESEITDLIRFLNKLINTNIDGLIIQDFGLFYIISNYFKTFKIHASTQLTTHNEGQIKFLSKLNAKRVNLSRELNLKEILHLSLVAHKHNILSEVFVHGSYCISFSGNCYMSSVQSGNSGNRGRCSQPCRDKYFPTPTNKEFPLNLKDNSAFFDLKELYDAGVDAIKIEGRIKKINYVFTVVEAYRKQIQNMFKAQLSNDNSVLYKVFNRDFTNSFLKGKINKNMFIDNPRNHSAIYLAKSKEGLYEENLEIAKKEVFEESKKKTTHIKSIIDKLSIDKIPVKLYVFGKLGELLRISVKTSDISFEELSEVNLMKTDRNRLNYTSLFQRLKTINETEFFIENLNLENLQDDLFISFKELTAIAKRIIYILKGSKESFAPIKLHALKRLKNELIKPYLSVLISNKKDLNLCKESSVNIYFQLPNSLKNNINEFVELFKKNKNLIPWFPTVLIGEDYDAALSILMQISVNKIVTNNSGIAYEADKLEIYWIAGPFLNIVNSYSLLTLKQFSFCKGSFISNEISKFQIKGIKKPKDFSLYYSIYHPIELMTSRQNFFYQITGCETNKIDDDFMHSYKNSETITNLKKNTFFVEKSVGNYSRIYNEYNFLNTDIVSDIPNTFSSFFVDLRDISTKTKVALNKPELIILFEKHINANINATNKLNEIISYTTDIQYRKGI